MLTNLFINSLMLISFTFIIGVLTNLIPKELFNKFYIKFFLGISAGGLGSLMIIYNFGAIGPNIFLDFRALSLLLIHSFAGIISTITATVITILFRLHFDGINQTAIIAALNLILILLFLYILDKKCSLRWKRWFYSLLSITLISFLSDCYLLKTINNPSIILYIVLLVLFGSLEFFLLEYVIKSNELFLIYKENSSKDFLTGLNNKRNFESLFEKCLKSTISKNQPLSCLMLDIDFFKKVNDTYGHAAGDIILKSFADIIKSCCKYTDIIGRLGGEEFCVLLPNCASKDSIAIAERIRKTVKYNKFNINNNKHINITVSIGVSTYPEYVSSLENIIELADKSLYKAKTNGRDQVCSYSKALPKKLATPINL